MANLKMLSDRQSFRNGGKPKYPKPKDTGINNCNTRIYPAWRQYLKESPKVTTGNAQEVKASEAAGLCEETENAIPDF
ncbi:MAG: hypothetical protein WAX69_26465 [Victivallales bacterium]